jgi:DNA-binding response OmpR family regulator
MLPPRRIVHLIETDGRVLYLLGEQDRVLKGDRIDLMIVDFVMPGMNGIEVARRVRLSQPGLPILVVTGFANTAALAAQTNSDLILSKPFRTTELVAKIEEALRSVPAGFG